MVLLAQLVRTPLVCKPVISLYDIIITAIYRGEIVCNYRNNSHHYHIIINNTRLVINFWMSISLIEFFFSLHNSSTYSFTQQSRAYSWKKTVNIYDEYDSWWTSAFTKTDVECQQSTWNARISHYVPYGQTHITTTDGKNKRSLCRWAVPYLTKEQHIININNTLHNKRKLKIRWCTLMAQYLARLLLQRNHISTV